MKKKLVALMLTMCALLLVGCGAKGGLTQYFGLREGDIASIHYWYNGRSVQLDASKNTEFMETFNVEYEYIDSSEVYRSGGQYTIYVTGAEKIALYVQLDGRVVAARSEGGYTSYYSTLQSVYIPYSLKS